MKIWVVCLFLASVFQAGENYRILGLFPLEIKNHMAMFEKLMKGLAEKGHEVDVLSHFPQETPIPRYKDISIWSTDPVFISNFTVPFVREHLGSYMDFLKFLFFEYGADTCKAILNSTGANELKATDRRYDLIIAEVVGADCLLGFAHYFKVPFVTISTSVDYPWGADRIGNPDNPSYIPNYLVPYGSRMNLMERLINTVVLLGAKIGYHVVSRQHSNTIAQEFFGPDLPDLDDLAYNNSLVLVNSHFSINQARPAVPNFIEVGGLHIEPPKPLPQRFDDLLDISKYKGIIYFSTGPMILTETMPSNKLKVLFDAFQELPYKIVWDGARKDMPKDLDIPPNIHFKAGVPQLDFLCHPNVKLFITHGGLMGIQEAVYCGVPHLGIPFFADQALNLKESEAKGIGIMVDYEDITKENIVTAARSLLEDLKYKENIERVSKLFRDRPLSAMDTAIYWTEYVIKHGGAPHLRTVGADLSWYQYHLVDVAVVLLALLTIFATLVYYVMTYTWQILVFSCRKRRTKSKRKSKSN